MAGSTIARPGADSQELVHESPDEQYVVQEHARPRAQAL